MDVAGVTPDAFCCFAEVVLRIGLLSCFELKIGVGIE
jgi:hypothetical protein